jgi:hypothetical protein
MNDQLTPWIRVLEKLIVAKLIEKFIALYSIFIFVFTTASHKALS